MYNYSLIDTLTETYTKSILSKITDKTTHKLADFFPDTIGLIYVDIDNMKYINDYYGLPSGDIVVKSVAQTIHNMLSENDYIIRWAGDEFVLILPGKILEDTISFAHNICKAVETSDNSIAPITISVGVAMYDNQSFENSIKNAYSVMKKQKAHSKNEN